MKIKTLALLIPAALMSMQLLAAQPDEGAELPKMGFFVTSRGIGNGADLGGLEGADAHCQALAEAVGSDRAWAAYLSTQGPDAVNARDRIGSGPWANAKGVVMATSVESLHYDNSNFNWIHARDENGHQFASRIDGNPDFSEHDILTGTQLDGTAFPPEQDRTCSNWTSDDEGSAWVGHGDRYSFTTPGSPWNSSHATPGCDQQSLIQVGGAGLLYCFAID
ncbi:MAG: hypothetical protein EBS81_02610 [Gammaproteobacteria bacterium]|nr:hypothetical protein [Gammaproteobacteria bacterium]